jgi:hypothetical protein
MSLALSESARAGLTRLASQYGLRNLRVFGSFARGEEQPGSDLDLLADYTPGQSGFAFFRFCREAEALVGRPVDVTTGDGLHPLIREVVLAEAVPL